MMILYDICLARGMDKWKHEKCISLSLVWQRQMTRGKKDDFVLCSFCHNNLFEEKDNLKN